MTVKYNVTGTKRKELVQLISNFTGCEPKYFTIDKSGALSFDDRADSEVIERLLEMLYDNGFEAEALPEADEPTEASEQQTDGAGLIVTIPFDKVSMGNLTKLLEVKGNLIKKALGIDDLPLAMNDDSVSFLWFKDEVLSPEYINAYTEFISLLCQMTTKQKRITATEKEYENEKYAFRCFLLRLGFIGAEHKAARKILLQKLEGSSAFKNGEKKGTEVQTDA